MKDTVGSSGLSAVQRVQMGLVMSRIHSTALFEVNEKRYQAICSCGWISTTSYIEEVDLLRAMHAHDIAVFGER